MAKNIVQQMIENRVNKLFEEVEKLAEEVSDDLTKAQNSASIIQQAMAGEIKPDKMKRYQALMFEFTMLNTMAGVFTPTLSGGAE